MNSKARDAAYATDRGAVSSTVARLDPRVRRTRRCLQKALLDLIREREFDTITVQNITERAELNRVTFYLHYRDKDDLLTQIMREALDELSEQLQQRKMSTGKMSSEDTQKVLVSWFEHAATHPELYHIVVGRNDRTSFMVQVRAHMERLMMEQLVSPEHEGCAANQRGGIPGAIRCRFLSSACLGAIGWWLEQRMPYTSEEMASWLWQLMERATGSDTP